MLDKPFYMIDFLSLSILKHIRKLRRTAVRLWKNLFRYTADFLEYARANVLNKDLYMVW